MNGKSKSIDSSETDKMESACKAGETPTASMSSWFSEWYDIAKKKMVETNEFMKRDLQEFSQAVQNDASRLVAATASTMKEKLHIMDLGEQSSEEVVTSFSDFVGNIASKVTPILPDRNEVQEVAIVGTALGNKVLSPYEARLYAIRTNPATFCNEPDGVRQPRQTESAMDFRTENSAGPRLSAAK